MSITQTKRRGRPPARIDAADLQRLIRDGRTIKAAAATLSVGQRTLQEHLQRRPDLRAAVDAGRRRGVRIGRPATQIDRDCEAGHWPAVRLRLLRNVRHHQSAWDRFEERRRTAQAVAAPDRAIAPGRPPARIEAADLRALVANGATLKQAASAIGVSIRALHTHLQRRADLRAAVDAGKRSTVQARTVEAHLDRMCDHGYWPANRVRVLRDLGWFRLGIGRVPTGLMGLRQTFERT